MNIITIIFILQILNFSYSKSVFLNADGSADTYKLINSVLGNNAEEVPDCGHKSFGHHITQKQDPDLRKNVFLFHSHVNEDNDRCKNFDRQRVEIKVHAPSKEYLKGKNKEKVSFSWNFKLDGKFQPSSGFTHIHQIKAADGDAGSPIITITPRKGTPNKLQLIHVDSKGKRPVLKEENLSKFLGLWVHAKEEITYGTNGKYSLILTDLDRGNILFKYQNNNIDLWRDKTTYVRPKWGLYRSIATKKINDQLRDEIVKFDSFCIAKGSDKCE